MQFGCGALSFIVLRKAGFSLQQGLVCNYYKMLVVIEMVPPTNVSFPIIK